MKESKQYFIKLLYKTKQLTGNEGSSPGSQGCTLFSRVFFDNRVNAPVFNIPEQPFKRGTAMAMKNTAAELLDDIYNIAYWMTGSTEGASHLVYRTYLKVSLKTSAIEVFKTFRDSYFDSFIHDKIACIPQPSCKPMAHLGEVIIQQEADVKLSVLMSEISGLKPCKIAKVIGVPLDNIRLWLTSGRRWLADKSISLDALYRAGVSCDWGS